MESIHVKENFKISMNKSELALSKTKLRRKGCNRSKTLQSSQSNNNETLPLIMKKLHEQRYSWKPHGKNSLYWTFY